jgi:hypothetical protein
LVSADKDQRKIANGQCKGQDEHRKRRVREGKVLAVRERSAGNFSRRRRQDLA